MTNLITIESQRGKVTFLYGVRTLSVASKLKGIDSIRDFIQSMLSPGFEDVAIMLFAGHENACYDQKKDLVYTSVDECYQLIEEIGMVEAIKITNKGIEYLAGAIKGGKKKVEEQ